VVVWPSGCTTTAVSRQRSGSRMGSRAKRTVAD
jgi:hypothetical protein